MRRVGIVAALSTLLMALSVSSAWAVAPGTYTGTFDFTQVKSGAHLQTGEVFCTVHDDLSVTCSTYELAGVGHTNADVRLVANYSATIECWNPGENPNNPIESHETSFSAESFITVTSTKNGRLTVPERSVSPFEEVQACPNPNWTPVIVDLTLESFTYTVTFEGFTGAFITISASDP